MPKRYALAQSGFSAQMGAGALAPISTGSLSALVDGAFTVCVDLQFQDNEECVLFGGEGTGTRDLFLKRNDGAVRDDSLTFLSTDASGDVRRVKWVDAIPVNDWGTFIFYSTGAGAGTLNLEVDNELREITSETNDAGFNADEDFDLSFGEVDAGKIGAFSFTNFYVYDRALTTEERARIVFAGEYPSDYVAGFAFNFPNIGLADGSALTPVVD